MKNLIAKFFKVSSYCVLGLIICLSIFMVTLKFLGEAPSVLGYNFYYVLTESMEPEINAGEMIIGQKTDPGELKIGDIITYKGEVGTLKGKIITHKIIEINEDLIITKGLANDITDPPINSSQIMSKYVGTVPFVGELFSLINTKFGFIFIIVTPLLLLIVNEISIIVKAVKENKEEHLCE